MSSPDRQTDPDAPAGGSAWAGRLIREVADKRVFFGAITLGSLALAVVIFLIARTIDPAPPRVVRMATGVDGGAYAATGAMLAERLAEDGVTLELVPTTGSIANLDLLVRGEGGVDVAVIQGGVGVERADFDQVELASLGAIFYEPMFLFVRSAAGVEDLRDLRGRTVAIGPPGSGVRALAQMLFDENGLEGDAVAASDLSGAAAAEALRAGTIDAAVFVTSPDRAYVRELFLDPRVRIVSFERADAYARRHRYLSAVTLPRGVIDLAQDAPGEEVRLIAPAAALVAREDLHPAIQSLLIQAAGEAFRSGDVVAPPSMFPTPNLVSFPLSAEAERYYERGGPSFLRRFLPFWAANLVDRLWVLAIPAATLLYPLIKSAPPIYRWQVQRRIIRWYKDLRELEREGRAAPDAASKAAVRARLAGVLDEVIALDVPLSYNDDAYRLRMHIRLVDQLIAESGEEPNVVPLGEAIAGE
ncbi:MAG: TAXI family TRAP transporter solute-binding subunit [Maricaulaceae bacterium]